MERDEYILGEDVTEYAEAQQPQPPRAIVRLEFTSEEFRQVAWAAQFDGRGPVSWARDVLLREAALPRFRVKEGT